MKFAKIFESALQDFLTRHSGGRELKNARRNFQQDLKRSDVRVSIAKVHDSWKDVDDSYIRICKKYPTIDMASTEEWNRRLTVETRNKYKALRQKIDQIRIDRGVGI